MLLHLRYLLQTLVKLIDLNLQSLLKMQKKEFNVHFFFYFIGMLLNLIQFFLLINLSLLI